MNLGGAVRLNKCGLIFIVAAGFLIILYAFGGGGQPSGEDSPGGYYGRFMNAGNLPFPFGRNHGKVSLRALLVAAIDVAHRGGQEVVAVRKGAAQLEENVKGKTKEGLKESATQGDYRSHRVMYYGLRKAFPGVKVISEEHTEAPDLADVPLPAMELDEISALMLSDETLNAEEVAVWIDPLDATKEYTENLLEYVTTMVGVAVRGKPVMGVIHRPFQDETYWAVVGHGHSPNLNKAVEHLDIPPSQNKKAGADPLRVIVSLSHAGNVQNLTAAALGSINAFKIIGAAGAGYKVLEVIGDRADAYVHVTAIKKWDVCAGYAIITAMEGSMTTLNGETIDFSGETDPRNSKGILATMKSSPEIDKLKSIKLVETS